MNIIYPHVNTFHFVYQALIFFLRHSLMYTAQLYRETSIHTIFPKVASVFFSFSFSFTMNSKECTILDIASHKDSFIIGIKHDLTYKVSFKYFLLYHFITRKNAK